MNLENELNSFVISIRRYLEAFSSSRLKPFLKDWPAVPFKMRQASPNYLPVLSYLPAALKAAHDQSRPIVQMLVSLSPNLAWGQTYAAGDFGPDFLERYGWTELIGLRGPIPSERIACGFLLLGPEVEYPRHSHEAQEVYIPMTHKTLWQRGNQAWTAHTAGTPRRHKPWEWHAMRTGSHPLLALFLWQGGNLVQKSRIEKISDHPENG